MKTAKLLAKIGMVSLSLLSALTYSAADNNENNYDDNQIERNEFISTPTASLWAYPHIRNGFDTETVSVWGCGNGHICRGNQIPPSSPYFSYGLYEFLLPDNIGQIENISFDFPITEVHNESNLMQDNPLYLHVLQNNPEWIQLIKTVRKFPTLNNSLQLLILEPADTIDTTNTLSYYGILDIRNDNSAKLMEDLMKLSYVKDDGLRYVCVALTSCIEGKISRKDYYELAGTSHTQETFQPKMVLHYSTN